MRITFGIHQGKTVKSLDTDKLQSFSNWLDEHPIAKDAPVKWRLERAHLVSAIQRELGTRDDESTDDEVQDPLDGPIPLGKLLTSGETRVYLGLLVLLDRNDGKQPFPASFESCAEIMGGSKRAWASTREKLMHYGYLIETSRGELAFNDPTKSTTLVQYPETPYKLLASLVGESKATTLFPGTVPTVYDTVDEAIKILGAQDADEPLKAEARKKLRKLLAPGRGYTVRDALAVAQWGRRMYDTGEERWHKMVDLLYLWSPTNFHAYLTAAQSAPAKKPGFTIMDTPEGAAEMDAEWMATLKRKGLI